MFLKYIFKTWAFVFRVKSFTLNLGSSFSYLSRASFIVFLELETKMQNKFKFNVCY